MSKQSSSGVPRLTHEQRVASAGQFERANQVLNTGNLDYGMQLLLNCCVIDPGNPTYRQALRQAQKAKYQNSLKGQKLAFLTTLRAKVKIKAAQKRGNYLKVLEFGEQVLMRNPWDVGTHLAMADAFENLDLAGLAIWTLDQIRQVDGNNPKINRPLARLFEKAGNFTSATALWQMVRKADPTDQEAQRKYKDLAASATIAKGRYQDAVQGGAPTPVVKGPGATNETAPDTALEHTGADMPHADEAQPAAAKPEKLEAAASAAANKEPEDKAPRDVAALKAKIQANPTNPNGYLHLAAVFRRADQLDKARTVLEAGLGPTANRFEMVMELIDLEIEPFRRDLAIAEEKLGNDPDNQELQTIRARLAKEIATRELDFFRKKSERFPTENAHRFEMGVRLLRCGQVDEAIRELQSVRTDPRHQGKALVYLGYCFQNRNNWRLAQRNFEEALNHLTAADEKYRKEILYQLARGYAATGELTRAVDLACELANLDFGYRDIGKLLDEWNAKVQKA
jgi:tetratricopeptide (TPR) repeat protein